VEEGIKLGVLVVYLGGGPGRRFPMGA